MATASALRIQIESALANRFPAALTPRTHTFRECYGTGMAAVDELLDGGFPVGAISELAGPRSSGRTSLALATVAERTRAGQVCGWVDASDALDPQSAAASGVRLERLLWVRCDGLQQKGRERWGRLDQALKSTDLLLQNGGFAVVVLDLGDIDPAEAMRIPLASWFRFRQAADRSRTTLLVLARRACAQSSAALVVDCHPMRLSVAGGTVITAATWQLSRRRQRFEQRSPRRPMDKIWNLSAAWAAEKSA